MFKKAFYILSLSFALLLLSGCGLLKASAVSARADEINTKGELYQKVENGLKNGHTSISFETEKLEAKDLDSMNSQHDGYYGTVTSYEMSGFKIFGKSRITLHCEISDNYYVERAILKGEDIPEERKEARKLLRVCKKLLPRIGGKKVSEYRREKRIHDLLVYNVAYGFVKGDEGEDSRAYTSYGALVDKKAVCNGYAQAMKLLCDLSGVECEMVTGTAGKENHAWNLVKLSDSWYHVDTTWDDPTPDDTERIFYHYFNVDDAFMARDHRWEKTGLPKAEGKEYNYYIINELTCDGIGQFRKICERIFEKDNPDTFQVQIKDYDEKTYSEENLQFLFRLSGADSLNMQSVGKEPCVTVLFRMSYD